MRRISLILFCLLLLPTISPAKTVYDIDLPEQTVIGSETLQLNGYGLRKKLFIKVYLGSLYTVDKVSSTTDALALPGSKLIRMDFIYSKVDKEKITEAFAEGFEKNSPQLSGDPAVAQFLALFTNDFVAGDRVDLILTSDGQVAATHNGKQLGEISSAALAEGVLLIYLGDEPADSGMKEGMLGL